MKRPRINEHNTEGEKIILRGLMLIGEDWERLKAGAERGDRDGWMASLAMDMSLSKL